LQNVDLATTSKKQGKNRYIFQTPVHPHFPFAAAFTAPNMYLNTLKLLHGDPLHDEARHM